MIFDLYKRAHRILTPTGGIIFLAFTRLLPGISPLLPPPIGGCEGEDEDEGEGEDVYLQLSRIYAWYELLKTHTIGCWILD
jgi:hypothetical protein